MKVPEEEQSMIHIDPEQGTINGKNPGQIVGDVLNEIEESIRNVFGRHRYGPYEPIAQSRPVVGTASTKQTP
jgi:hypothetical protein